MSHQADLSGYLVSGSGGKGLPVVNPDGSAVGSADKISNVDTADSTYYYFGDAAIGSANSDSAWRISRMTKSSPYLVRFAAGGAFSQVWNDRASLTYS